MNRDGTGRFTPEFREYLRQLSERAALGLPCHDGKIQPPRECADPDVVEDYVRERFCPERIDRRHLELTRLTVDKIDANPELADIGQQHLDCQREKHAGTLPIALQQWQDIINTHTWQEIRELLLEESDRGQYLRSSHPYLGLLTFDERMDVYATY